MKNYRIESKSGCALREISTLAYPTALAPCKASLRPVIEKWLRECDKRIFASQAALAEALSSILEGEDREIGDYLIRTVRGRSENTVTLYEETFDLVARPAVRKAQGSAVDRGGDFIPQVTYGGGVVVPRHQDPKKNHGKRGSQCFVTFRVKAGKGKPTDRFAIRCRSAREAEGMVDAVREMGVFSHVRTNRCGQVIRSATLLSGYKGLPQEIADFRPKQLTIKESAE